MIADEQVVRLTRADLKKWDVQPKAQARRYHGNRTPEPRTQVQARHSATDVRVSPVVPPDIRMAVQHFAHTHNLSLNLAYMKLLVRGLLAVQDGEDL